MKWKKIIKTAILTGTSYSWRPDPIYAEWPRSAHPHLPRGSITLKHVTIGMLEHRPCVRHVLWCGAVVCTWKSQKTKPFNVIGGTKGHSNGCPNLLLDGGDGYRKREYNRNGERDVLIMLVEGRCWELSQYSSIIVMGFVILISSTGYNDEWTIYVHRTEYNYTTSEQFLFTEFKLHNQSVEITVLKRNVHSVDRLYCIDTQCSV